jgi:hypothetical protein
MPCLKLALAEHWIAMSKSHVYSFIVKKKKKKKAYVFANPPVLYSSLYQSNGLPALSI